MDYTPILCSTSLFCGIPTEELRVLLEHLHPTLRSCGKGEVLLQCGEPCRAMGILLSGKMEAFRPMPDGHRIPTAQMERGGIFGDVLGGTGLNSPVTVQMTEAGQVLFFSYERLLEPPTDCTAAYSKMMHNLVGSIGNKYFSLMARVELLTLKSLRAKICAYLLHAAAQAGADTFSVPHSRAAMAEYLSCERSALSRELSRMQAEGLLETYKNSFKLLDRAQIEKLGHI